MINQKIKIEIPDEVVSNWQEIVNLLAQINHIPSALIMRYTDPHIEVLVSSKTEGNPYHPGDKETFWGSGLYCETVIRTNRKLLVPNALDDENWKNNPDIKLNMISYLGFPILLPDHEPFGTICVLDNKTNEYSETTEKLMQQFRSLIESHLEIIFMNQILGDQNRKLTDYLREIQTFRGLVFICMHCKSIKDIQGHWHPIEDYLINHPEADFSHSICPNCREKYYKDFI